MADDLASMYGVETPANMAAAEQARRASMTHGPELAAGVQAQPQPQLLIPPRGPAQPLPPSDAELTALMQQVEREDAPPVLQGTEALAGAMAGGEADLAYYQSQIDANQPFTTTRANPLRPQAERRDREQQAREGEARPMFEAEPFVAPPQAAGESDEEYANRVDLFGMMHEDEQAQQAAEFATASAAPAARDVGRDGNVGMIESDRRAQEDVYEAQTQMVERSSAARAEAAIAERSALAEAREGMQAERDFQTDQRDALLRMREVESKARAKLEAMPDFEASRYTANMGTGQKALALLAGLAGGFAGNPGAVTQRMDDLDRKALDEQKLNYEMGIKSYDAATGAVDQGMNLYGMLANELGDPAAAEAMFLDMAGQDRMAMFEEQMSGTVSAEQKAVLEQEQLIHEQNLRDRRDMEEQRLMATPENLVTHSDPGRRARRAAEKQIEKEQDFRRDMRAKGVDIGVGREEQEARVGLEHVKQRGVATAKRAEAQAMEEKEIKKATKSWGQVETMIDEYLESRPGEMYSVGIPGMGTKQQRVDEEQFFLLMPEILTNAVTGAVASPEQKETFTKLIAGDWSDMGDEDRRSRLRALTGLAGSQRRFFQNQLGSPDTPVRAESVASFRPM